MNSINCKFIIIVKPYNIKIKMNEIRPFYLVFKKTLPKIKFSTFRKKYDTYSFKSLKLKNAIGKFSLENTP